MGNKLINVNFKKKLNNSENLKKALELVKIYNITKNIPFKKNLYKRYTDKYSWDGELGHSCNIKLNRKNNLTIYEENVFEKTLFVDIKLKTLLNYE